MMQIWGCFSPPLSIFRKLVKKFRELVAFGLFTEKCFSYSIFLLFFKLFFNKTLIFTKKPLIVTEKRKPPALLY